MSNNWNVRIVISPGVIFLLLLILKLAHALDIGWIWVLAPLWIPVALVFSIWAFVALIAVLAAIFDV